MTQYSVDWNRGDRKKAPRSSYWFTLSGVITYASAKLKRYEGSLHLDLVASLRFHGYTTEQTGPLCVPNTTKYHKQLLATVEATLGRCPR